MLFPFFLGKFHSIFDFNWVENFEITNKFAIDYSINIMIIFGAYVAYHEDFNLF